MKSVFALLSALVLVAQVSNAEDPNTRIRLNTIKLERLNSIESPTTPTGTGSVAFKPKKWMFLEGRLNIQAAPVPRTKFLDKITVRFYVAAKNPEGRDSLLMTKEIEYVNVPVDEEFYVCVFMSPSSIKRLTGSENVGSSTFTLCGLEVIYKDNVVAQESNKGKPGWWANPRATLVPTDSFPLLNKNETPFAMFWYDRYPEIAPSKDGATPAKSSSSSSTPVTPVTPATTPATPAATEN